MEPLTRRFGSFFDRPTVWNDAVAREATVDPSLIVGAIAASLVIGLLLAIPLFIEVRSQGGATLTDRPASTRRPERRSRLGFFILTQASAATVLLVVSGLVLKSLAVAAGVDPGFETDRLVAAQVTTSSAGVPADERSAYFRRLLEELRDEPWVDRVTASSPRAPLSDHPTLELRSTSGSQPVEATVAQVRPEYLSTLGIAILDGRGLADAGHGPLSDDGRGQRGRGTSAARWRASGGPGRSSCPTPTARSTRSASSGWRATFTCRVS